MASGEAVFLDASCCVLSVSTSSSAGKLGLASRTLLSTTTPEKACWNKILTVLEKLQLDY